MIRIDQLLPWNGYPNQWTSLEGYEFVDNALAIIAALYQAFFIHGV